MPRERFAYLLLLLLASASATEAWSAVAPQNPEDAPTAADDDCSPPWAPHRTILGAEFDRQQPDRATAWVASFPAALRIRVATLAGLREPFAVPLLYLLMSLQR